MHIRPILTAVTAVSAGLLAQAAIAQDDAPLVDVRFRGVSEIEPAAKDAAAHRTLLSLGSRLRLLPREIPGFDVDRATMDAAWRLATGSGGLQVWSDRGKPTFSIALAPAGGTEGVLAAIENFFEENAPEGEYARNEDGTLRVDSPGGWIQFGADRVGDRDALAIRLNEAPLAPLDPQRFDLPAGTEPLLSMSIGVGEGVGVLRDVIEQEEPDALAQIERFGFLDAGDARLTVALGASDDLAIVSARLTEAKPWLGRFFGEASFTRDNLAVVPADATVVAASCVDLAWTLDVMQAISEDTGRDFIREVREGFGIDLDSGVLANVGPRWIYYQSDTTGGGGVLSGVLVAELRDPDAFARTHAAALVHANQFGSALGRGYARTREWQLDGGTVWSAVFPGLPVPFEPSWTIAGDRLLIAATTASLTAAVAQLDAAGSVLDNPLFQQAVGDRWPADAVMQISFIDTPRFAAKGYGSANLAASALANAARQPFNAAAEPGTIMPSYAAFTQGIRPLGAITTWDGDDLVQRASMDSSALVQIAAAVGQSSGWQSMYVPAMGAGVLMPALGKARESAQQVKSSTQVRAVVQGAITLHQDDPNALITIERLLDAGAITEDMLVSPVGSAWDGGPDIVLRQSFGEAGLDSFDATLIVAMDRAMYVNGEDVVNIGFADAHVEAVSYWEVGDYLDMPKNAGLREEWDLD